MGNLCTSVCSVVSPVGVGDIAPSKEQVTEIVAERIPQLTRDYSDYYYKYSRGMEESAPEKYVCEEVLTNEGHPALQKGVDNDKKVQKMAMAAAANESVRNEIKDEVWEQFEPEVTEATEKISMDRFRKLAVDAARETSDALVDEVIDETMEDIAKKLESEQKLAREEK